MEKLLHSDAVQVNERANGLQGVVFVTNYYGTEDGELRHEQEIHLQSHGNVSKIMLGTLVFTPEALRKLADSIETNTKRLEGVALL